MTEASAKQIQVVFATPSYQRAVSLEYITSLIPTLHRLSLMGIPHGFLFRGGDPYLAKVRNRIVTDFLTMYPDATDLFWLDDDIGWPAEKVLEFLLRPEDIIAGVYPKKSDDLDFPVELNAADGALLRQDGLLVASSVPGGFLRVKRHVLEKLAELNGTCQDEHGVAYNIYEMGKTQDGMWCGEDAIFSRKCCAEGFQILVDPDINFGHRGSKIWTANLSDHLGGFERQLVSGRGEGGLFKSPPGRPLDLAQLEALK